MDGEETDIDVEELHRLLEGDASGVAPRDLVTATFETIPDAVFIVALPEREIAVCNPAAAEMFGYDRESLIGESTEILHVDAERHREFHEESIEPLRENCVFRDEFEMQRADGSVFPTEHHVALVDWPEDGGDPSYAVSVVRDVSGQVETERALEKSQQKFETAFRKNPVAMAIVETEERRFVDGNRGLADLVEYDIGELVGERVDEFDLWPVPEDLDEIERRLAEKGEVRNYETVLKRRSGEVRDILFSAERIELDGEPCRLAVARDVTRRRRYEAELEHRALHDSLTGLANRTLFRDRVDQSLRRSSDGTDVTVMVFDLDRFGVINDSLGRAAGDEVLEHVAERLVGCVPSEATVARVGGDEFAVLMEDSNDIEDLRARCGDWVTIISEPCEVGDTVVHPDVSVGMATGQPDEVDADDLLRRADVAVSMSRTGAHESPYCYDPDSDAHTSDRLDREHVLRRAVEKGEFVNRYQPLVDLESGRPVGVEALVRWEHPDRGVLSPGEFIALAEETGLIVPMGLQVLEQALRDGRGWIGRVSTPGSEPFRVSVNLSAEQCRDPGVVDEILNLAEETDFPLEHLVLEITESVLLSGCSSLQELRDAGARIAIDDFGTGYSSLQYLRRLEADELKIDRSFVAELPDGERERVLVDAMLTMGRRFGLRVVCEGVETVGQREALLEMGGKVAQGYYFDRPLAFDAIEEAYVDDE